MSEGLSPSACVARVVECDNARDKAGYRAILHDDYKAYVYGKLSSTDADAEADALARWWTMASDVHLEILEIYELGSRVTLRYKLVGTNDGEFAGQPATFKNFDAEGCTLFEVLDGRVKQVWRYFDTIGLVTQLGLALPGASGT